MITIQNSNERSKVTASRLARRVMAMAVLVGLFSAVIISGLFYSHIRQIAVQEGLVRLNGDAVRIEALLKDVFINIERDLMFLSLSTPMHRVLNGDDANGAALHLTDLFTSTLQSNPFYEQVRYIRFDKNGREIVRVNRSNGTVLVTPPDLLQSKKAEPYFEMAQQLPVHEVHFMDITLNREHGEISDPPTPMLRVLVGLDDDAGVKKGFLVINVDFQRVFQAALNSLDGDRQLYVVNQHGDFLIHPDPQKTFGFEYGRPVRLADEFPQAAQFMEAAQGDAGIVLADRSGSEAIGLHKFYFVPRAPDKFWGVGVAAGHDVLLAAARKSLRDSAEYILAAIIVVAALAGVFTLFLTRPLRRREVEMADNQQFLNLIIENIPDIIFIKDSDFRIVSANDAFLALYPPEQRDKVIGTTTLEAYPPEQAEEFTREDRRALEKGYSQAYETIDFPDGTQRTLFTKKVGFTDHNGRRLLMGVARDITELKDVEAKLVAANADLERFAFIASHDLQEPLRMITNFNGLLAEEYADKLDDDARMYIDFSVDAASRMQELINDLLEYSRMQQEDTGSTWVEAHQVLDGVMNNLKRMIEESGAVITHGDLPRVHINPMQLTRVLQNLVSNAIKYRHPDRKPEIRIDTHQEEGRYVFSVADNGIGIDEKYFKQIFQLFKRLHSYDKLPGTGIGLAICKKIVSAWGGDIWLESTPDEGSVFFFSIPDRSAG